MKTALVTRGGLEALRDAVEYSRIGHDHHPYNISRRTRWRVMLFPLKRGRDYEALNVNAPPMQQLPRRVR